MRLVVLPMLLSGCAEPVPVPIVDGSAWVQMDASDDPLPTHSEGLTACSPEGWGPELGGLEVETGVCAYASLEQPLLIDLQTGDAIEIAWWHQTLNAETPTEGHIALLIGEQILWERTIAIPGDARSYNDSATMPLDAPAGTAIRLHLHNHGANSWNLNKVTALIRE